MSSKNMKFMNKLLLFFLKKHARHPLRPRKSSHGLTVCIVYTVAGKMHTFLKAAY
uniref:Uncharacterized protein n=1 Tax=Anguilla anguilla TaxID=7936 RepID=A0A0E9QCB1_ANGAN